MLCLQAPLPLFSPDDVGQALVDSHSEILDTRILAAEHGREAACLCADMPLLIQSCHPPRTSNTVMQRGGRRLDNTFLCCPKRCQVGSSSFEPTQAFGRMVSCALGGELCGHKGTRSLDDRAWSLCPCLVSHLPRAEPSGMILSLTPAPKSQ
ncbi:hypothetical protein LZ30DRAFT_359327 [Colletotrichum cereale]|nr:hypothetical protein LZ30DRAFT_359327 [Colletotrichum cereale]